MICEFLVYGKCLTLYSKTQRAFSLCGPSAPSAPKWTRILPSPLYGTYNVPAPPVVKCHGTQIPFLLLREKKSPPIRIRRQAFAAFPGNLRSTPPPPNRVKHIHFFAVDGPSHQMGSPSLAGDLHGRIHHWGVGKVGNFPTKILSLEIYWKIFPVKNQFRPDVKTF